MSLVLDWLRSSEAPAIANACSRAQLTSPSDARSDFEKVCASDFESSSVLARQTGRRFKAVPNHSSNLRVSATLSGPSWKGNKVLHGLGTHLGAIVCIFRLCFCHLSLSSAFVPAVRFVMLSLLMEDEGEI